MRITRGASSCLVSPFIIIVTTAVVVVVRPVFFLSEPLYVEVSPLPFAVFVQVITKGGGSVEVVDLMYMNEIAQCTIFERLLSTLHRVLLQRYRTETCKGHVKMKPCNEGMKVELPEQIGVSMAMQGIQRLIVKETRRVVWCLLRVCPSD